MNKTICNMTKISWKDTVNHSNMGLLVLSLAH